MNMEEVLKTDADSAYK